MNTYTTKFIISAQTPHLSGLDCIRQHESLKAVLELSGYRPVECIGVFEGERERSLMIGTTDYTSAMSLLKNLCVDFHQKAFLEIGPNGHTYLHWMRANNNEEYLGLMRTVSEEPKGADYTFIPSLNTYLVAP